MAALPQAYCWRMRPSRVTDLDATLVTAHRLLHITARITCGQRNVFLRLAQHWPWALALAQPFTRLRQIQLPV